MANFRKSVPKPAPGSGAPKPKNGIVKVVYAADISVFPPSDSNGVKMEGNIALKAGAKVETLYLTDDTQKLSHSTEGDADAEGFLKKAEASHPGDSLEINEFVQNTIGEGVILFVDIECNGTGYKVLGTPCNPMYLKGELTDDKDGVKHMFNFEQRRRDRFVAKFYDGALPLTEPFMNPAFAVDYRQVVNPSGTYNLPASTVADTEVTINGADGTHNRVITLVGGGGAEPATLSDGINGPVTVHLKNGTDWVALKGAVINFRIFTGVTYHLFEISRA